MITVVITNIIFIKFFFLFSANLTQDIEFVTILLEMPHLPPLHTAISDKNTNLIEYLIAHGANVNSKDHRGLYPLHLVAKQENFSSSKKIAKLLTDSGANLNSINFRHNKTPLNVAIDSKNIPVIKHLLSCGASVNKCRKISYTPLHYFAHTLNTGSKINQYEAKELQEAKILLENAANVNEKNGHGQTILHLGASKKNVKLMKLFLKYKADVNIEDKSGKTVLNDAARYSNFEIIQLVVNHGADVNNASNFDGSTPLHEVCSNNDKRSIKFLLRKGANINALNSAKQTPLMCALIRYGSLNEAVEFLLNKWPDVNLIDSKGKNVLDYCCDQTDLSEVILRHLAKVEALNLPLNPSLLETISKNTKLNNYFTSCKKELLKTKETQIHPDYSINFFDFLVANKRLLVVHARNKNLIETFTDKDRLDEFPIYGRFIRKT